MRTQFRLLLVGVVSLVSSAALASVPTVLQASVPSGSVQAGQSLNVTYNLQAVPTSIDYTIFVHFTDAGGNIVFQDPDFQPAPPTTQWSGAVAISHSVAVPSGVPAATYQLRMGLSNPNPPYDRLALNAGPGVTVDGELRYIAGSVTVGSAVTTVLQASPASASVQAGQSVAVTYNFTAAPTPIDATIFVHFTDAGGNIVFQDPDFQPAPPTSQWSGAVAISRGVAVPSNVPAGTYQLRIGLSNPNPPYDRLTLAAGPGVTADNELRYIAGSVAVGGAPPPPPPDPGSGVPPECQAAGFTSLAFQIDPTQGIDIGWDGAPGHDWYPGVWWQQGNVGLGAPQQSNISISNGVLHFRNDSVISTAMDTDPVPQSAGASHGFQYGCFDIDAQWDDWGSFWMMSLYHAQRQPQVSSNPLTCTSELDMFEGDSGTANTLVSTVHRDTSNDCGIPDAINPTGNNNADVGHQVTGTRHRVTTVWTPPPGPGQVGHVAFYLDDVKVNETDTWDSSDQPMFLVVGSSSGGVNGGPTLQPVFFDLYSMHVWQKP